VEAVEYILEIIHSVLNVVNRSVESGDGSLDFQVLAMKLDYLQRFILVGSVNSFSSGRKVAILSGVVLNAYIFQTIHRTETEIALFERGGLLLSNDTNFNFIPSLVNDLLAYICINYDIKKCCNYA
jgi:hypothetical protein